MKYTQEMKDNGDQLFSGIEYLDENGQACKFIGDCDGLFVGRLFEVPPLGERPMLSISSVANPIRTPEQLEEEKLFNYLRSIVDSMVDKREEEHRGYDRDYMLSEVRSLYNAGFIAEPK